MSVGLADTSCRTAGATCLFGLGAVLEECFDQVVLALGRPPDFLCDNDARKWGMVFRGVRCLSPAELQALGPEVRVLITVRNHDAIGAQLMSMGISDTWIVAYERGYHRVRGVRKLADEQAGHAGQGAAVMDVRGRWTLVTGSSRGLGRLIAVAMAKLGSNLVLHGRASSHLESVAEECARQGVEIVSLGAELGDRDQVEAFVADLERKAPQLDIVFNNAAISLHNPSGFWEIPSADFLAAYAVNSVAPIRICQRLVPSMIRRGFGRVICVSSGLQWTPEAMAYACSKAALNKFVHDLAPSLAGTGVGLSLVDPGWLKTDMGGADAPLDAASALPGVLLGVLLDADVNGCWFTAQDYTGLGLEDAARRARATFTARQDCIPWLFDPTRR